MNKLKDSPDKIKMINDVFKEQLQLGIIERVPSPEKIPETFPGYSYLAHMPVFRLEKISSPCRVVFLSNLNGKGASIISHNQAMLSGPNLNRKLSTALISLRFDPFLLCFDLKKAFLQIELEECDQYRLLFLWFKNIEQGDYTLVTYKNVRLSFGLRCSPTLLMLALFKILIVDTENDTLDIKSLKKSIYNLIYMDNGAITANSREEIREKCKLLQPIFSPYKFDLQQFVTNDEQLQAHLDKSSDSEPTPEVVKLLGIQWDRTRDMLFTSPMKLSIEAKSKRQILRSIAENIDPYGYNLPIMNRARLFLHKLQLDKSLGWDTVLKETQLHEWGLIARQVNSSKPVELSRFVGQSDHQFRLIAFTDSSKELYGTVIYIHNLTTNNINLLLAKNRVITKQLESKSIPTLEFHAIALGVEVIMDTFYELTGRDSVNPIDVVDLHVYTDSYVALNWLNSYRKLEKLKNLSVFTMNRLVKIAKLCDKKAITFKFVNGLQNPADFVTRTVSAKKLRATNFVSAPKFLTESASVAHDRQDLLEVLIPDPLAEKTAEKIANNFQAICDTDNTQLELYQFILERYSTFKRVFNCFVGIFKYMNNLKAKLKKSNPNKYSHFKILSLQDLNYKVMNYIIRCDYFLQFREVFEYFAKANVPKKCIPGLITQLNLCIDNNQIIRVNSKFDKPKVYEPSIYCPVLLSRHSRLTLLIARDMHNELEQANRYTVLLELQKKFWIPRGYALVKEISQNCVICKKKHNRPVAINQNAYRTFRAQPPNNPFQYVFLDHAGPYYVYNGKIKQKVWVLVICCLWSRAINLEICWDLTANTFLKAFQLHIFQHGLSSLTLSDLGTSLVSGSNKIQMYIFNDSETHHFFRYNNIETPKFDQYFKGRHEFGALVEISVKLTRDLISGAVRNLVLGKDDFNFIIKQTVHIVNRRPIAFKDALRDTNSVDLPEIITPEQLIYGRVLTSINIIPELQPNDLSKLAPENPNYSEAFVKLSQVRQRLVESYHNVFIQNLIQQATNLTKRYWPSKHHKLQIGDIVLIKDPMIKPQKYPLGKILQTFENELNEVTQAIVLKGDTGEKLKRHVSSLIPILTNLMPNDGVGSMVKETQLETKNVSPVHSRVQRKAACESQEKTKQVFDKALV